MNKRQTNLFNYIEQIRTIHFQTGFAKIYGTAGGGDGLLRGYLTFALPNSKLIITMAKECGMTLEGEINEEIGLTLSGLRSKRAQSAIMDLLLILFAILINSCSFFSNNKFFIVL
ncbi:MAG TPA: hypothetical protein VMZ29_04680 [Candidatus Bathyarchaeia archaeon]|nr:hypothetical protein [Candidatus Bathyarchaeia archaeon]